MIAATDVELPFAGGTFRFHLGQYEMRCLELGQAHQDGNPLHRVGPMRLGEVYARILRGRYTIDGQDVGVPGEAAYSVTELDTLIRMALLGGGGGTRDGERITWKEWDVEDFMRRHVHPLPLVKRWDLALAVLGACVEGRQSAADDPLPAAA